MNESSQTLQLAAETVFSVLAPAASRIARVTVRFRDNADTASTDGHVVINMPGAFAGRPIPEDAPVTLGLLAHELGHWVQPLEAVTEIARTRGAPHWLVNVALDIHGETFVEAVFPAMREPLKATRQAVNQKMMDRYRRDLKEAIAADDFHAMAMNASFISRFRYPDDAWSWNSFRRLPQRIEHFVDWMLTLFDARLASPGDLPENFSDLLNMFPELTQSAEDDAQSESQGGQSSDDETGGDGSDQGEEAGEEDRSNAEDDADADHNEADKAAAGATNKGNGSAEDDDSAEDDSGGDGAGSGDPVLDEWPEYPDSEVDEIGRILQRKVQDNARNYRTSKTQLETLIVSNAKFKHADPEARRLSRTLEARFQVRKGALEVAAPGRLDRLDMVRGAPVPLRMTLPGKDAPGPQLVLAIDVSGSMFPRKASKARIAAQAVTLAIKAAGGKGVVILFSVTAYITAEEDGRLAFLSVDGMQNLSGGTSFEFLEKAWRRWPDHQVLVLTDGHGTMPSPLANDRERTSVILIDSDVDVSQFAARAVPLNDLDHLSSVFATLIPTTY